MHKIKLIGINTLRGFFGPLVNFSVLFFGIKYFGKESWGALINVMIWVFFFSLILNWGNKDYLLRKYSETPHHMMHFFYSNFLTRSFLLVTCLILFLFFPTTIAFYAILLIILLHCYRSLDSLVIFFQQFEMQLAAEFLGLLILLGGILYVEAFDLKTFLILYCWTYCLKIVWLFWKLQLWNKPFTFQLSTDEFKGGFLFFCIGFSGWLVSKIDVYVVDFYFSHTTLSEYQMFMSSFLILQALPTLIIMPFTKHVYRLPHLKMQQLKLKLSLISIPLISLGTFFIWVILNYFLNLNLHYTYYFLGGLSTIPCFLYSLDVMELYKAHFETKVVYINLIGAILNIVLLVIFIEEYQIIGVISSICIVQWVLLWMYKKANFM